jgi:gliding motility-associated-like protein
VNGDANSKVVNPYFQADTVPLPFQRALNGAGIAIPGVAVDIEGKTRFSQAPDVGCLEFFVDYGILDLLSPSLNCFHPEIDSVIVYIRQYGDVPFNDLKVAYQMNGGPVHQDTIPGPHLEDVIHNFGVTEDLTTYGDYLFKVWLINTLDDNINNDTLYAWRYSKPSPEPSFTYDNFCTGPKVYFMGQSSVPAPYYIVSYEWLFGDGETSTEQNPVHTYAASGTYQVAFRAYSDAGCYGEIIQDVFINPEFVPLTLDYSITSETCLWAGDGSIAVSISGGFPPVTLTMNGQPVSGDTVSGLSTGQYYFEATDSQNCVLKDTVTLSSLVFMNPHIFAEPLTGNSPLTVSFDFTASGADDWMWHFTEEDTDTSRMPTFTFFDYGTHLVTIDVMSGPPYNCTETATIEIFVDVIISIETNNVFTPNDDGVNDYFEIRTTGIKEIDASIYNVWGNRVNKIESLEGKWDGTTEGGAKSPDGTYFWSLKATGADNIIYERQGSVLLLRHAAEAVPNPVKDRVLIKVYDDVEPPVEIKVFSSLGTLVCTEIVNDVENITTDLSRLDRGVYFIRVTSGRTNYFVRVVKN